MPSETFTRTKALLKHLLVTAGSGIGLVLIFFHIYLPISTNHGETITVPDVRSQPYSELDNILISRNLRYEINVDSGYSAEQEPLTVLDQFPKSNAKVKENRKIYITLNARRAPLVKMPDLVDKSLKIAQITLASFDLRLGNTEYVPDNALNAVIDQLYKGEDILPGQLIPKGSTIDFKVGDGRGNRFWDMYKYTEQSLDEARIAIIGAGLKIGTITYVSDPMTVSKAEFLEDDIVDAEIVASIGEIIRHVPAQGQRVKLLDLVDLWVYQPDSISNDSSILDIQN